MPNFWKQAQRYPMSKMGSAYAGHYKFLKRRKRVKVAEPPEKNLQPIVSPPQKKV